MDPTQYFQNRLKYLEAQETDGKNPYPHKFQVSMSITEYIGQYGGLNNGEHLEDVAIALAGRVMSKRSSSSKLFFYDLHEGGAKVQVMADARQKGNSRCMEAVLDDCRILLEAVSDDCRTLSESRTSEFDKISIMN